MQTCIDHAISIGEHISHRDLRAGCHPSRHQRDMDAAIRLLPEAISLARGDEDVEWEARVYGVV